MQLLINMLKEHKDEIVCQSLKSLHRAHLKSYECSEDSENKERLKNLFELTIHSIENKSLIAMNSYVEEMATTRYNSGFNFYEVHSAFNVLEESIWKFVMKHIAPENVGDALGMVSTVLGSGKEILAGTFVALAGKTKMQTLDLSSMFNH